MPPAVRALTNNTLPADHLRGLLGQVGPVPQRFSRKHPAPILQVDVQPGEGDWWTPDIAKWRRIKRGQDGADDTMEITINLHTARVQSEHFRRLTNIFNPNLRVRLLAPWGGEDDRILFQGYPQPITLSWSDKHSSMSITCLSEGQDILRTSPRCQIMGRMMRRNPAGEWNSEDPKIQEVESLDVVFNMGGKPNRTTEAYRFGVYDDEPGRKGGEEDTRPELFLFTTDDAPGAKLWTYAQALRHIAYLYIKSAGVPINVAEFLADTESLATEDPMPWTIEPFDRRITGYCPDVSVQSLNVDEAIATLCQRAGLHYHIPVRSTGAEDSVTASFHLRVHATVNNWAESQDGVIKRREMREGKVFDLPREPPFQDHSGRDAQAVAETNKAVAANITIDPRAINWLIARGGPITYEVTLLLRPGWLPNTLLDSLQVAWPGETSEQHEARQKAAIAWWAAQFDAGVDDDGIPGTVYDGQHPDNYTVADMFRLWVFPDVVDYVNPYAPLFGLDRIYDEDWYTPFWDKGNPSWGLVYADSTRGGGLPLGYVKRWVPRRRPFLNTIGRTDLASGDTAPIVEVNFSHAGGPAEALTASGWMKYTGPVHIDPLRAAIRFEENDIFRGESLLVDPDEPNDDNGTAIARYIRGQFYVAITCTIESDARMRQTAYKRTMTWRRRSQIMDYGLERFQDRRRWGIIPHLDETDPAYLARDDNEELYHQARRDLEHLSGDVVSGSPEIFWIDPTYWPGDSFSGIDGLAIPFLNYPGVERIEYVNEGGDYRTKLHLSDLRDSPEVDSE